MRVLIQIVALQLVIFSFGAFEKLKLYEARHLFKMTIARQPDVGGTMTSLSGVLVITGFLSSDNLRFVRRSEHPMFMMPIDSNAQASR